MNLLSYLFRQSRPLWVFATITGLIAGLSGAGLIAVISQAVNGERQGPMLAVTFFGLCAVHLATKGYSEIALLRLTQSIILDLRTTLSRRLLTTPFKQLQAVGKPGLLAILTKDIDTLTAASQLLPVTFGNAVIIVACLGYMAWLSWQVFLIFTVCLALCMLGFHLAERHPLQQLNRVREQMEDLYRHFRDLVEGSKELILNAARGGMFVEQVVTPAAREFRLTFNRAMSSYTWVSNAGTILFYLLIGMLLFIVPLWLPQRAGLLTSVTLILLYLTRPIADMMGAVPALRQADIALQQIHQLNDSLAGERTDVHAGDPFAATAPLRLELRGVGHHYPGKTDDARFFLGPLDLTIGHGEILFVVGGNGSGKTTLAMLLLGLYEPEQGTLLLNGTPVTPSNIVAYRRYFSAVFADFHLFQHLLGADEQLHARAAEYLDLFGIAHKVTISEGKFSTIDLSTGQRKRLALVSAFLEDRQVYLFDEWAADQDPVFKKVFYTELLPELKARGKTVIVISHDDAYFHCADRLIKVADGRLDAMPAPRVDYAGLASKAA